MLHNQAHHFSLPGRLLPQPLGRRIATSAGLQLRKKPTFTTANTLSHFGCFARVVPTELRNATPAPHYIVPSHIPYPTYATTQAPAPTALGASTDQAIQYTNPADLTRIRRACRLAASTLDYIQPYVQPGITTQRLDEIIYAYIIENHAYPSPLRYNGFPAASCTSVNNIMAHGIPDKRPLHDGDIINIDITVYKDGFHGDTSRTFLVGRVDRPGRKLVAAAREALMAGVNVCGPGVPLRKIGEAIEDVVTKQGLHVAELLAGHGIGREFHCYPTIAHHRNSEAGTMETGMVFTVEPALCQGDTMGLLWPDQWTVGTMDGGRSAQFEHTVLITDTGHEVLT
ncbi:hypothetical protein H4R34_003366 [Dimargaris verticillata]|uniref:Methionine aminopeptidase n=1 Tax=Dimargaris verticillata TaxID=2761393 RepID=A0A9W8E8B7_9FUNG|nr:hypothetical protein H4R34_003366 [Dimargaris verticillata]